MTKFDPTFKDRPLSWSQLSCFEWNQDDWYTRYVLRIKPEKTPAMIFGDYVDKRLQTDPTFFPEIPRHSRLQYKIVTKFRKIHLIGFLDSYEPPFLPRGSAEYRMAKLDDYKTGAKAWTQKRVDETGQLTMYDFLLWQSQKIHPDDVKLGIWWIPTQENGDFTVSQLKGSRPKYFETKRSMAEVLTFGQYISKTVKEMEAYVKAKSSEADD